MDQWTREDESDYQRLGAKLSSNRDSLKNHIEDRKMNLLEIRRNLAILRMKNKVKRQGPFFKVAVFVMLLGVGSCVGSIADSGNLTFFGIGIGLLALSALFNWFNEMLTSMSNDGIIAKLIDESSKQGGQVAQEHVGHAQVTIGHSAESTVNNRDSNNSSTEQVSNNSNESIGKDMMRNFIVVVVVLTLLGFGGLIFWFSNRASGSNDPKIPVERKVQGTAPQTSAPPDPHKLTSSILKIEASSFYKKHPPDHAFDGLVNTAWNEREKGSGEGAWVEIAFDSSKEINKIEMTAGWDYLSKKNVDLFEANSHLKKLTVVFDDGTQEVDVSSSQRSIAIEGLNFKTKKIRFVADEVWPGKRWQDLSISEIVIWGN